MDKSSVNEGSAVNRSAVDWLAAWVLAEYCFTLLGREKTLALCSLLDTWSDPKRPEGNLCIFPIFPYAG
jgi:hypothetical protein